MLWPQFRTRPTLARYLYDWGAIDEPSARFENLVALELLARTELWTESGGEEWGLAFIRNREGGDRFPASETAAAFLSSGMQADAD